MIRCPRCGLRLRDAQPVCPAHGSLSHGAPSVAAQVEAAEPELSFAVPGYEITGELGRGGFGVVYAAVRGRDGLKVALKVGMSDQPEATDLLAREADALDEVGTPHVPAVYERGLAGGLPFIALELIEAPTLADVLVQAAGPVPVERFATLASAILEPLAAIHARGFVHFDLKPENIFVPASAAARIIDFGLARRQRSTSEAGAKIGAEAIGTAEYMSPEQCDGLTHVDVRSDLYSIGVLFYELLCGAPPFWGKAADVREAQRSRRPASLRLKIGCTTELSRVIGRCLVKDPALRFADVTSLRSALDTALAGGGGSRAASVKPVALHAAESSGYAAAVPREKRTVGLVFFESRSGLSGVQPAVIQTGGQIVQANGVQYIAAFGHDVADNPARLALVAAHRLLASKLAARCLVDVAAVSIQLRPDGSRRLFSPIFAKKDRFPGPTDPPGVVLTQAATEVIPDLQILHIAGTANRFTLDTTVTASGTATLGVQLSPLVGRDDIISRLLHSATRAMRASEPTLVTVEAEAGHGRTHLASTLAYQLDRLPSQPDVIRLVAQESLVGAVSQLVPDLLRRLLELPGATPHDGGRALFGDRYGEAMGEQVWPGAAFSLGWIDASHPDVARLAAAPGALRLAVARAAGEALRRRARQRPVAVLLDDAHLADEATLDALEYATLKEAGARIWACVLVRPSFAAARPNWGTRAARAEKQSLGPLAAADAVELTRHLLLPVEYVPPLALSRLAERAQGVPRLLVELIRGLKRDGLIRRSERGTGHYLATDELDKLPDLPILQWNASREVEALPAQLAGHARLCAVLGSHFTLGEVEGLLLILERNGLPDDMQLDANVGLQRLVDASILLRRRGGVFDFRHALLRDTIYQLVPEAQRRALHQAALQLYEGADMPSERRRPRYALHAARSGAKEAAAAAYLELAERALSTQAYLEAEAAFGSALENLTVEDDPRIIDAARGRGLMRFRLSRHEDALKDLRRARELAHVLGGTQQEMELMLDEATVLDWTRDLSQSAELVRKVAASVTEPTGLLAARLALGLTRIHHRLGESSACVRLGAEASAMALRLGHAGYETRVIGLLMMAPDYANLGRFEEAKRWFEAAIAETQAHSDLHHLGAAYINRSLLWLAMKDASRLFEDLAQAIRTAREVGEPLIEYAAHCNMGEAKYTMAELDDASAHTRRAIELAGQLWGETSLEVGTRELLLARIALYRGDASSVRDLAGKVRAKIAEQRASESTAGDFLASDHMLLEMVELGARSADEAEWEALEARSLAVELQPLEQVELIESRALCAFQNGLFDESRRLFERALEVSTNKPNPLSERVLRQFQQRFGSSRG